MRSTKELLELVKERFVNAEEGERLFGLCNVIEYLLLEKTINTKEFRYLESYIKKTPSFKYENFKGR